MDRKQVFKLIFSITGLAFTGLVMFGLFGPKSCGPDEDQVKLLATLNNLDEVAQKEGVIKTVKADKGKDGKDDVYRFEAEVLNKEGVGIGKVRGGRIEGFGTMKPHFIWYKTPGVPEDFPPRPERGRRGDGQQRQGGQGGQPNQGGGDQKK